MLAIREPCLNKSRRHQISMCVCGGEGGGGGGCAYTLSYQSQRTGTPQPQVDHGKDTHAKHISTVHYTLTALKIMCNGRGTLKLSA